ncbi:MAG: trypsin-like peptidase domain-containing protein [Candidatus Methanomethylicia archaeon]|jgi:S1-C subfamily serine protease|nr:trypsin-like peptidase domain-containing protein [Candidatus Methanomethylicia archaeon]
MNRENPYNIAALFLIIFIAGAYIGYSLSLYSSSSLMTKVESLQNKISSLESKLNALQTSLLSLQQNNVTLASPSLFDLYDSVKASVVMIKGLMPVSDLFGTTYQEVLGSGFVVNLTGTPLIVTNYHVVENMIQGSVTFLDGEAYPFEVLGKDKYSDLAILRPAAPQNKLIPIPVASSSNLHVGDLVVAIGNPYGLQSTLTSGIVSQLGRAIQTETASGYLIADVIQISTPINPGNSGGPLLDSNGRVVGITTAIISGSQNVGFAVPSDTLIREFKDLVEKGKYDHPYLGINGLTVDYLVAKTVGLNYTYGVLIQSVTKNSPAERAGLKGGTKVVTLAGRQIYVGGDLILALDQHTIKTMEDLSSYLERETVPGQSVELTVIRDGQTLSIPVTIGIRP